MGSPGADLGSPGTDVGGSRHWETGSRLVVMPAAYMTLRDKQKRRKYEIGGDEEVLKCANKTSQRRRNAQTKHRSVLSHRRTGSAK